MNVRRGDVVLIQYPFALGAGSSRRPALIVQNDQDNDRLQNTIVAQITANLRRASDSRHLFIDLNTPEGHQSGLLDNSVVSCINLATVHQDRIERVTGHLPESAISRIDDCLKAALGLP
jgi:mRNA interferase MazF